MKKILAHQRLQRVLNQKGNKPKAVKAKARILDKAKERVEQIILGQQRWLRRRRCGGGIWRKIIVCFVCNKPGENGTS